MGSPEKLRPWRWRRAAAWLLGIAGASPVAAASAADLQDPCAEQLGAVAEQPWPTPATRLQAARCLAAEGRQEDALEQARQAVEHSVFREAEALASDRGLAALHALPGWAPLMVRASAQAALPEPTGSGVDIRHMRRHLPKVPSAVLRGLGSRSITLLVWVAPDATPARVEVEQSSGVAEVDALAVQAAGQWKYIAAVSNGETFGYPVRIPLTLQP